MNADFHRILTLLRKEKGVSQKQVAASLGISQALLSHYEKGIRECGLEFVVKVADYYGVSCDYLLGRSPDRAGLTLSVDDLPDGDGGRQNAFAGSIMPVLNKKLITNSLHIVFDMLSKGRNDSLTREVSSYLPRPDFAVPGRRDVVWLRTARRRRCADRQGLRRHGGSVLQDGL